MAVLKLWQFSGSTPMTSTSGRMVLMARAVPRFHLFKFLLFWLDVRGKKIRNLKKKFKGQKISLNNNLYFVIRSQMHIHTKCVQD